MDLAAKVCTCLVISNRHLAVSLKSLFFSLVKPFIKDYFILESCLSNTWLSVWANTFLWNSCLQVFHNQDGEWGADVCVDVSLSQCQSIYPMKEESGWWQMFSCLCSCYIKGDQVDIPPSPRGWGCRHHHRSRSTVSLRMRKCTSLTVASLLYLNKVCSTLHIKSLYTVHQVTVHILKRYREINGLCPMTQSCFRRSVAAANIRKTIYYIHST